MSGGMQMPDSHTHLHVFSPHSVHKPAQKKSFGKQAAWNEQLTPGRQEPSVQEALTGDDLPSASAMPIPAIINIVKTELRIRLLADSRTFMLSPGKTNEVM
jgi:hypothetical protein